MYFKKYERPGTKKLYRRTKILNFLRKQKIGALMCVSTLCPYLSFHSIAEESTHAILARSEYPERVQIPSE